MHMHIYIYIFIGRFDVTHGPSRTHAEAWFVAATKGKPRRERLAALVMLLLLLPLRCELHYPTECATTQPARPLFFWALSPRLGVLGGKRSHHTGRICRGILRGSGANFNFSQKKKARGEKSSGFCPIFVSVKGTHHAHRNTFNT